jgi:subtilisin family serine protease
LAYVSQGANIAFTKGMIVVASAGNTGASATEPHIGVPAEATNVLAVGAVKADETYATFSSIGPSFDQRVKPDVMAQGQSSVVSNVAGAITTISGTSISCPILAGTITSFWQAFPNLTNQQIVDLVKQSSDRFSNPNAQFGYGIPDFQLAYANGLLQVNSNSNQGFVIAPNPVNHFLNITFPATLSHAKLLLFNSLGQLVLEKNAIESNASISLDNLNRGMYFYKMESGAYTQTGKIIKN